MVRENSESIAAGISPAQNNTEAFSGKTGVYANARPGYPNAVMDYITSLIPDNSVFADIGAGTGKFSALIAQRGYSLFAVEPNKEMRDLLAVTLAPFQNAKIVVGTAEASTLPEHCVDVITCAQALHWFDRDAFRAECRRIGKPGAMVFVVYNGSDFPKGKTSAEAFFKNLAIQEFDNPQYYTRERWLQYMSSHAGDPLPSALGYDEHISKMNAVFDRESENGLLFRAAMTQVYHEVL